MSCLTIFADDAPDAPLVRLVEPDAIAAALAPIGVRFERWDLVPSSSDHPDAVLAAYRPNLDALLGAMTGEGGAGHADVVSMTPDHPGADELRQRFLAEHTHTEDEVRFFVAGAGNFVLHAGSRIYDAHCTAGDLIGVPAEIPHWFDAGPTPDFTVLRVFTDRAGWVPHFTGRRLDAAFPAGR